MKIPKIPVSKTSSQRISPLSFQRGSRSRGSRGSRVSRKSRGSRRSRGSRGFPSPLPFPLAAPFLSVGVPCSWGCMGEMCSTRISRIPFGQGEQAQRWGFGESIAAVPADEVQESLLGKPGTSRLAEAQNVAHGLGGYPRSWQPWRWCSSWIWAFVDQLKLSNLSRDIIPAEALFLKHCFPLFLLLGTADIKKMLRMSSASRFSDACSNKDAQG